MAADETDAEVIASALDQTERFEAIFDRHAAERSLLSAPPSRRAPRRRADSRDVHARIPRQTAIRHQPRLCAPMAIRHRRDPGHDAPGFRTPGARVSAIRRDTHPTILNQRSRRAPRCERARISAQGGACRLSPDQREVLLLHAWGGLSHAEITEALSVQAPSAANAFTAPARRPPNDASPRVRVSSPPVLVSSVVTLAVCCYEAGVIVVRWL
jgi:Sigma-70, region 4